MAKIHKIGSDYFTYTHFSHNVTNNIIVELYEYSHYDETFTFMMDISDMVVDYSYDCTSDDNIHQTASLTLHVETDDQRWFMQRENKMREWVVESSGSSYNLMAKSWRKVCYKLRKTYTDHNTGITNEINLGYFIPTSNDYSYSPTDGTITISLAGLSMLLTKEFGGGIVSYTETKIIFDPITQQKTGEMTLPVSLSVAEDTSINSDLLFRLAMGSASQKISLMDYTAPIPLCGATIGYGQKLYMLPYDVDFDSDIGRADELQQIMDLAFEGATFWVDEDRYLNMSSKPTKRNGVELFWTDYGELFLSESSSYNNDNYYNITEVFGKDNMYYAICDWSNFDGGVTHYARKQVISDDTLQSNEECMARAKWETYKGRYHHQTWTVTIDDKYIKKFNKPSQLVGNRVEYTTVDGDTNLFFLNKLSYSSNKWTMELSLFRPLYETDMKQYENQLHTPSICGHEIIDNKYIRLFVTGEDIESAIVKIYTTDPYGVQDAQAGFRTESCLVAENGIDKYVDIPIKGNGTYKFCAALYSPYYLDSGETDGWYMVDVNLTVAETVDTDPYPHPPIYIDEGGHSPYLMTNKLTVLTDSDGNALTI